jgi:YcaO cyclodehydratase, ATP-ad Mg2+-binding
MADSKKLADWLLENAKRLDLRAKRFQWVEEWGLAGYYDLEVSIVVNGRTFIGRGTALGEDLAFVKAGAEAIERAYCAGHNIPSVGVAIHDTELLACENARSELIERDGFFCHFYTKTPFFNSSLHLAELKKNHSFKHALTKLEDQGIEFRIHQAWTGRQPVFICSAAGKFSKPAFGGVIGLGSHESNWESIRSAFLECMRNIAAIVSSAHADSCTEREFQTIKAPNAADRQRLARNVEYWSTFDFLFPHGVESPESITNLLTKAHKPGPNIVNIKLDCPFPELKSAPIFVYRSRLTESYGSLISETDKSPVTMARLSEFLGRPISREELETRPHFLG